MEIKVKKLHKDAKLPYKQYDGDACFDLYAIEEKKIPLEGAKIHFGIAWEIPRGYEAVVRSRSSSFVKKNLHILVGTVDQQYRGELLCFATYLKEPIGEHEFYTVQKGESIAQVAFRKVPIFNVRWVDKLSKTDRGASGFGSTDSKPSHGHGMEH